MTIVIIINHDNYDNDDLMIKQEKEWYDYQEGRGMIRCFLLWSASSDDVRGQVSCVFIKGDKRMELTES